MPTETMTEDKAKKLFGMGFPPTADKLRATATEIAGQNQASLLHTRLAGSAGKIYGQLIKVMAAIESIGKTRQNPDQKWYFRGIDDAYNALHGPLAEHGVFVVPQLLEHRRDVTTTTTGKSIHMATVRVMFTFYADDGSHVEAIVPGEAFDMGDKSYGKAMSYALKTALFQVFCIPTIGDNDPDAHAYEVAEGAPAAQGSTTVADELLGAAVQPTSAVPHKWADFFKGCQELSDRDCKKLVLGETDFRAIYQELLMLAPEVAKTPQEAAQWIRNNGALGMVEHGGGEVSGPRLTKKEQT